jgi:hypothetical protein
MAHPIHRVEHVEIVEQYTIRVLFEDRTEQEIDLEPVLAGELYGPLRDPELFRTAFVDPEVHTVVWPNGADFDPALLHDWPDHADAMRDLTKTWAIAPARS